jgi:hypothetical protein
MLVDLLVEQVEFAAWADGEQTASAAAASAAR